MPYTVKFTDNDNKTPLTVFDNTASTDTSLIFPGRNVTGYGQIIAENFLHLLENFASASNNPPINPTEGQLWYDSTNGFLQLFDGTNWKAASNIQKSPVQPSVETSKVGELWVDTTNQQLRIYTGTRWILVGPSESSIDGLRYGPAIETIIDSDNSNRSVLIFYIADVPVIMISKDSFSPKVTIDGFALIKSGININTPTNPAQAANFDGGYLPKYYGTSLIANALKVDPDYNPEDPTIITAGKFLRSDQTNTTNYGIVIKNNAGVTVGLDGNFNISTTPTAARIYNSSAGSSVDLQVNRNGVPSTILRVLDNKIGINKAVPVEALDVDGNITLNGNIIVTNPTASTNLSNGSIQTLGGLSVTKNVLIGAGLNVTGTTQVNNLQPATTDIYDNGTSLKRWNTVRAKNIIADTISGILDGNISGDANRALSLKNVTTFQLTGDIVSPAIQFDGQVGSYTKIFNTSLTANIISAKSNPFPNISKKTDYVLTYRESESGSASSGLLKQTRDVFVADLGVPIGAILPYAGANAPYGYLFCDGGEVERIKYPELYDIISTTYNGTTVLSGVGTFRLPDLRSRFPLGKDNMDNGGTVPNSVGGYVDGGGGATSPSRVPDTKAQILGADAGQSSVTLTVANLPDHRHNMKNAGVQYASIRVDTAINPPATTGFGPTAPGQAQYLTNSGYIDADGTTLSTAIGIMNPYQTLNYIIRSGPPAFSTTV